MPQKLVRNIIIISGIRSYTSDLILEELLAAAKQHSIRYINFVGDGDCSVYPTLVPNIKGWGYSIKKQKCANNAWKCY